METFKYDKKSLIPKFGMKYYNNYNCLTFTICYSVLYTLNEIWQNVEVNALNYSILLINELIKEHLVAQFL